MLESCQYRNIYKGRDKIGVECNRDGIPRRITCELVCQECAAGKYPVDIFPDEGSLYDIVDCEDTGEVLEVLETPEEAALLGDVICGKVADIFEEVSTIVEFVESGCAGKEDAGEDE